MRAFSVPGLLFFPVLAMMGMQGTAQSSGLPQTEERYPTSYVTPQNAEETFLRSTRLLLRKQQDELLQSQNEGPRASTPVQDQPADTELFASETLATVPETVLVASIDARSDVSSTGNAVEKQADVLMFNKNASATYNVNIDSNDRYLIKLSTSQMIKGVVLPLDYQFDVNIYVDGDLAANVDLSAKNKFVASDLIDLGNIAQGTHSLTFEWTNFSKGKGYITKFGMRGIELYRAVSTATFPTVGFTARYDGSFLGIVGGDEPPVGFLSTKKATEDRTIFEFDLLGKLASVDPVYLNFYMVNLDNPNSSQLSLYGFEGDGVKNATDFFRTDTFITDFSDGGIVQDTSLLNPYNAFSLDVTDLYNSYVDEGKQYLGFVILAEATNARYLLDSCESGCFPGDLGLSYEALPGAYQ